MYTFTCQKTLPHTLLLLAFKIVESFSVSLRTYSFTTDLLIQGQLSCGKPQNITRNLLDINCMNIFAVTYF